MFPKVPPDTPPTLYGYKIANFPETLDHIPYMNMNTFQSIDIHRKTQLKSFQSYIMTLLYTIRKASWPGALCKTLMGATENHHNPSGI